jgi:hypothetical protein
MAGYYPAAPDHKIFYTDNGTLAFTQQVSGGAVSEMTSAALNAEQTGNVIDFWYDEGRIGFVFPQLMDIVGIFYMTNAGGVGKVRTSLDTTNGSDGVWTIVNSNLPMSIRDAAGASLAWRNSVVPVSILGIKGLTLEGNGRYVQAVHLYGRPSAGQAADRLRFWHPTTDTEVLGPHFDYGDQPRGLTSTIQFRIKNNSTTKTANTITITDDALTAANPTLASQTRFSSDNSSYNPTLSIGNLAPGALSPVLYARLILATNAAIGPWRQRFLATPTSWV